MSQQNWKNRWNHNWNKHWKDPADVTSPVIFISFLRLMRIKHQLCIKWTQCPGINTTNLPKLLQLFLSNISSLACSTVLSHSSTSSVALMWFISSWCTLDQLIIILVQAYRVGQIRLSGIGSVSPFILTCYPLTSVLVWNRKLGLRLSTGCDCSLTQLWVFNKVNQLDVYHLTAKKRGSLLVREEFSSSAY